MALRKLLLILSLFIIGDCFGQSPMFKLIAKKSGGCSYLLDQYSGAAAAYSLRKLDCDYAGSAIRVRRSSDNTEQDIGFVNGNLDTASLKTFVGTGGTNDGFVVTWYDQSGNANNATQSTGANQPYIMDNGVINRDNNFPSIRFVNTNNNFMSFTAINGDQPYSSFMVQRRISTSNIGMWLATDASYPYAPVIYINFGAFISHSGATSAGNNAAENSTANILLSGFATAANTYQIYKNGSSLSLTSSAASVTGSFTRIGRRNSEYSNATVQEIILYKSDKTSDRAGIESNINSYYSLY